MKLNPETKLYESQYWHPAVTADAVVFAYDVALPALEVLLIKRAKAKPGEIGAFEDWWALPGGFMRENDQDIKACMKRELEEETCLKLSGIFGDDGIAPCDMQELPCFSKIDRDPRERHVITIPFMILVEKEDFPIRGMDDAAEAAWIDVKRLPANLAFDHREIIDTALDTLKKRALATLSKKAYKVSENDAEEQNFAFRMLKDPFTMTEMRVLYEILTGGEQLDRSNFRKRMLEIGGIEVSAGREMSLGCKLAHRPEVYYTSQPRKRK